MHPERCFNWKVGMEIELMFSGQYSCRRITAGIKYNYGVHLQLKELSGLLLSSHIWIQMLEFGFSRGFLHDCLTTTQSP